MEQRIFLNAGCGEPGSGVVSPLFRTWREIRVDLDPHTRPDIVASITELEGIADASVDAVWASHCLEHLYAHDVPRAVAAFNRVLKADGFICLLVPDLQAAAKAIIEDKLSEPIYRSLSGPVTAHDMVFGYGPAIAQGSVFMAHRCGFTPTVLGKALLSGGFPEVIVHRRVRFLELAGVALKTESKTPEHRTALITELGI